MGALSAISIEPGLGEGQKIGRLGTFDPLKNWNGHEKGHGFELLSLGKRFLFVCYFVMFPSPAVYSKVDMADDGMNGMVG